MAQNDNFQAAPVSADVANRIAEVLESVNGNDISGVRFGEAVAGPEREQVEDQLFAGDAIADDFMAWLLSPAAAEELKAHKDMQETLKFIQRDDHPSAPGQD